MTAGEGNWAGMGSPAPREAAADLRASARQIREYFLALVAEGFTESQALEIVGHLLRSPGSSGGTA